jgi:hypothetical protein
VRILSVGFPLPGVPIDNYTFATAPCFFDYDALFVDPQAFRALVTDIRGGRGEHHLPSGERIVDGAPASGEVALCDLLHARRREVERLLDRDSLIITFAFHGDGGSVEKDKETSLYCWLPEGRQPVPRLLLSGSGTIGDVELDRPFGPLVHGLRAHLAYRAYFDECLLSEAAGTAFAHSAGGAAIAVEMRCNNGQLVFLPPPAKPLEPEQRYEFSDQLQSAVQQRLRVASASKAPHWLADYSNWAALDGIERFRALLWQQGRYGLEEHVRAAFSLLGFRMMAAGLDAPGVIESPGPERTRALFEVDASDGAVGLEAHYRLRRRIEEAIARSERPRALLVINGYRATPPEERSDQFQQPLQVSAERMRYCVVTTTQLFRAVRAAFAGDDATVASFRRRLLTTDGVLQDD